MSRRLVLIGGIVVAAIVAAFLSMHLFMTPPTDLDLSRSKPSVAGTYLVEIAPENEPLEQGPLHNWTITVKTPDGKPVDNAAIGVDGGMPQHGHGLPTAPQATASLGEGRYRIEGVRFNMSGWWELKFAISAAPGDDVVVFNVTL